ncbi:13331_t:CDS:2 [Entrophospora sp. SA101]|nr:13331_t:CDS:2 [Entrophospora sp. SA101]CAJ0907633.1 19052_t:CDS:2 [Entrophospora sp. SA101]
MSGISDAEKQQYLQLFSQLNPSPSGHITGIQAKDWLIKSNLPNIIKSTINLKRDLCDIDKDGRLDFDEFTVTCRLVNDLLARVYPEVPKFLPPQLVPPSKVRHLLSVNSGVGNTFGSNTSLINSGIYPTQSITQIPQLTTITPPQSMQSLSSISSLSAISNRFGSFPAAPLSDDFDWYMPPADKFNYENEYSKKVDQNGYVRFTSFDDLYTRLGISREEGIAAWNLADVNFEQKLGKDQSLVFLHILNQRSKGKRIPDNMPSALKTSLLKGKLNYNYNEVQDPSWRSKSSSNSKVEEEKLEKELAELDEKINKTQDAASNSYTRALSGKNLSSTVAELKELLSYKQAYLLELENVELAEKLISQMQDVKQSLNNQVSILKNNFELAVTEYNSLKQEVNNAKMGK